MPNQLLKKAGTIKSSVPTDDDMIKINKHSLKTLTKDDVYVLKMYACDNETDDRNYEPFDLNALNKTIRYVTKSKVRYFFPFGTKVCCIWHMACQVLCTQKTFQKENKKMLFSK